MGAAPPRDLHHRNQRDQSSAAIIAQSIGGAVAAAAGISPGRWPVPERRVLASEAAAALAARACGDGQCVWGPVHQWPDFAGHSGAVHRRLRWQRRLQCRRGRVHRSLCFRRHSWRRRRHQWERGHRLRDRHLRHHHAALPVSGHSGAVHWRSGGNGGFAIAGSGATGGGDAKVSVGGAGATGGGGGSGQRAGGVTVKRSRHLHQWLSLGRHSRPVHRRRRRQWRVEPCLQPFGR